MIVKERKIPLSILKLQALARRTPLDHPKFQLIKENLAKSMAGYKGEAAIDYPLSLLPEKNYLILHDIRLQNKQHYFQMDTLLLSQNYLLILEVKNMLGTLFFDNKFKQLIRTLDGKQESYPYPLVQIQQHEDHLRSWLARNNFADIPIHSLVVISSPYTLIQTNVDKDHRNQKIIHKEYLPQILSQLEVNYTKQTLSKKELKKLAKILDKQDTPLDQQILERYQISKDDLRKGVYCPKCETLPITRHYNTWICPKCSLPFKDAHLFSLYDYFLLIGRTITNKELREFLDISSPALATRILISMNLPHKGENKGRVYELQQQLFTIIKK